MNRAKKIINAFAIVFFLVPIFASAAVTKINNSVYKFSGDNVTVSSGATYAVIYVNSVVESPPSSVTLGGVAATQIGSELYLQGGLRSMGLWVVVNPPVGSDALVLDVGGSDGNMITTFSGVASVGDFTATDGVNTVDVTATNNGAWIVGNGNEPGGDVSGGTGDCELDLGIGPAALNSPSTVSSGLHSCGFTYSGGFIDDAMFAAVLEPSVTPPPPPPPPSPASGLGVIVNNATSSFETKTGFTMNSVGLWMWENLGKPFTGSGIGVLYTLRWYIMVLIILAIIIFFAFRYYRYFKT